jgi:hypothetical protein
MPRATKDSRTRQTRKGALESAICSPHRSSRCGVCYWALYDGDWCQNAKCVMSGRSVNEIRVLLTNEEARILIEANSEVSVSGVNNQKP